MPPSSGRDCATRTGRCSAPSAASPPAGGSRRSTSSCASSRRARGRSTRSMRAGFDHESVVEADWLSGACLLVRRRATEQVGLFDESFFLFSEETDWCYRFHQAGWRVLFDPERRGRARRRCHARRRALPRESARAPPLRRRSTTAWSRRSGRGGCWCTHCGSAAALFRGERGAGYREAARWLGAAPAERYL